MGEYSVSQRIVNYSFIISFGSAKNVITTSKLKEFTDEVNIAISNGWQPFGEVNARYIDDLFLIMQVIVEYEN
jgi:hypothetical protein